MLYNAVQNSGHIPAIHSKRSAAYSFILADDVRGVEGDFTGKDLKEYAGCGGGGGLPPIALSKGFVNEVGN